MNKFVFFSFVFMAWAFFEMSGGTDFVPRKAELMAAAQAAREAEETNRDVLVTALKPEGSVAVTQPRITRVSVTNSIDLVTAPTAPPPAAASLAIVAETPAQPTLISLEQSGALFARPLDQLGQQTQILTDLTRTTDIREVAGTSVNMRNGPGTRFGVLTSLPRGTEVEVIESDGTGWVKLRTINDQTVGWMAERLLTDPTG